MMAKILLPLLLIVSAVAGDDVGDLCNQLVGQLNSLQSLAPLEVNVNFPRPPNPTFVSGHSKFRIISGLTVPSDGCSSVFERDNARKVTITLKSDKAYILSPTKIILVINPTYTLSLTVKEVEYEKTVSLSDFDFAYTNMYEDYTEIAAIHKSFISKSLKNSLQQELGMKLHANFNLDKRVEIDASLVKQLRQNVYLATAQDF